MSIHEEIIIGRNPVFEALHSKRPINKILIAEQISKKTEQEIQAKAKADTIVQKVPKSKLDQLSDGKHLGILAFVSPYEYAAVEDILKRAKEKDELPFILILDEIEDPHNLGAMLHSRCFRVHAVNYTKRRSVGLSETVAKTSAGAVEHILLQE